MKAFFYIILLTQLVFCTQTNLDFERESLEIRKQKIEILTANRIFDNYIIKNGSYSSNIYSKIENEFKENAEYPFILETIKTKITANEKLNEFMEKNKLIDFVKIVKPILSRIIQDLPGPNTKILFVPSNPEYVDFYRKHQIAVTAITVGAGKIIVSIDPTSNWQEQLPYVLAHEYHHSVWTSRNFTTKDFTPLEYLIFEGRADSFAKKMYPNVHSPWTSIIDKNVEKRVWRIIKPELNNRQTKMNDQMMVGNEEIPYGSGYTIGFNIVEEFKRNNPKIKDSVLIDMKPERILELSSY